MKLVIAIVRPEKVNDVLEALYRAEVRGISMSRVQGHGGELDRVETYRGTTVKMGLSEKVRFEVAVSDAFVQPTIDALLRRRTHRRGRRRQDLRRRRSSRPSASAPARPTKAPSRRWTNEPDPRLPGLRAHQRRRHRLDARRDARWCCLMTPALGLFYAGLVRSKNTLNTFMMSIAALAVATVDVGARRLLARLRRGQRLHRRARLSRCCTAWRSRRARGRRSRSSSSSPSRRRSASSPSRSSPAPSSSACGSRPSSSSPACGRCSSMPCSPTGPSAAAGCRRTARSTSPAACRSRWARASPRLRPRLSSAHARTTAARRCCPTTPSTCCSALGCCGSAGSASTAAAASRPGTRACSRSPTRC